MCVHRKWSSAFITSLITDSNALGGSALSASRGLRLGGKMVIGVDLSSLATHSLTPLCNVIHDATFCSTLDWMHYGIAIDFHHFFVMTWFLHSILNLRHGSLSLSLSLSRKWQLLIGGVYSSQCLLGPLLCHLHAEAISPSSDRFHRGQPLSLDGIL